MTGALNPPFGDLQWINSSSTGLLLCCVDLHTYMIYNIEDTDDSVTSYNTILSVFTCTARLDTLFKKIHATALSPVTVLVLNMFNMKDFSSLVQKCIERRAVVSCVNTEHALVYVVYYAYISGRGELLELQN